MSASPRTRTAVLAASAALALATLAACGEESGTATDPAGGTDRSSQETPAGADDAKGDAGGPGGMGDAGEDGAQTTVPVYFVADAPGGPRLFREFRRVPGADPLAGAVALMTSGDALDPDYRTAYPEGEFASVKHTDGAFEVALADDSWTTAAGMDSSDEPTLAIQQLVYTLQGVQQERSPVEVVLDGEPTTLFGVDTTGGVTAADQIETLGLVSVTSPEEGASVGDTFTASGVASSFEATVPWEVRQGDKVVKTGFATAEGWMDKLYPWQSEVDVSDLAPGRYTFVARTDDPSEGEGGGPTEDTKTITIR